MIGWIRMPEVVRDEKDKRGSWIGMMSMPRAVDVEDGHIYFRVHPYVDACYSRRCLSLDEIDMDRPFRIKAPIRDGETLNVCGYQITMEDGCVCTDRSSVFPELGNYRTRAQTPKTGKETCQLDIFVSPHLIEVFVNDGQYVITHVVYGLRKKLAGKIEELLVEE